MRKRFSHKKLQSIIFFDKLKKTEWVSYIKLTKQKEIETESSCTFQIEFHYLQDQDALTDLPDEFKKR